jgi:hypothetical protein
MIIIHAGFMLAGLVVLAAGIVIAMGMRRKRWWLTVHRRLGSAGALCVLLGFVAAISMVFLRQTGQHFAVPHAWLGIIVVLFVACTYVIGTMQIKTQRAGLRPPHRWAGRATLVLLFFNVLSGLSLIGIL